MRLLIGREGKKGKGGEVTFWVAGTTGADGPVRAQCGPAAVQWCVGGALRRPLWPAVVGWTGLQQRPSVDCPLAPAVWRLVWCALVPEVVRCARVVQSGTEWRAPCPCGPTAVLR